MKKYVEAVLCGLLLLSGCGGGSMGGGSMGGGSPDASLSATSLAFGSESVGTTSPVQTITLSNPGTATLSIVSIAVAATTDFEQTNTCGSTLVRGANCTLSVTFSPTTTGSLNGTISIADNATGSPQTVTLSGTATAGSCSMKGEGCDPHNSSSCCVGLLCRTRGVQSICE